MQQSRGGLPTLKILSLALSAAVAVAMLGGTPSLWAQNANATLVVAVGGDIQTIDLRVTSGAPFQHEMVRCPARPC